jgi:hypothetical protein
MPPFDVTVLTASPGGVDGSVAARVLSGYENAAGQCGVGIAIREDSTKALQGHRPAFARLQSAVVGVPCGTYLGSELNGITEEIVVDDQQEGQGQRGREAI